MFLLFIPFPAYGFQLSAPAAAAGRLSADRKVRDGHPFLAAAAQRLFYLFSNAEKPTPGSS
jgi:hypothetical protein